MKLWYVVEHRKIRDAYFFYRLIFILRGWKPPLKFTPKITFLWISPILLNIFEWIKMEKIYHEKSNKTIWVSFLRVTTLIFYRGKTRNKWLLWVSKKTIFHPISLVIIYLFLKDLIIINRWIPFESNKYFKNHGLWKKKIVEFIGCNSSMFVFHLQGD